MAPPRRWRPYGAVPAAILTDSGHAETRMLMHSKVRGPHNKAAWVGDQRDGHRPMITVGSDDGNCSSGRFSAAPVTRVTRGTRGTRRTLVVTGEDGRFLLNVAACRQWWVFAYGGY